MIIVKILLSTLHLLQNIRNLILEVHQMKVVFLRFHKLTKNDNCQQDQFFILIKIPIEKRYMLLTKKLREGSIKKY